MSLQPIASFATLCNATESNTLSQRCETKVFTPALGIPSVEERLEGNLRLRVQAVIPEYMRMNPQAHLVLGGRGRVL
jgi:hypothetical protein